MRQDENSLKNYAGLLSPSGSVVLLESPSSRSSASSSSSYKSGINGGIFYAVIGTNDLVLLLFQGTLFAWGRRGFIGVMIGDIRGMRT